MTQEEKNLLLRDLCARLPYGVKVRRIVHTTDVDTIESVELFGLGWLKEFYAGEAEFFPYLRPMSFMSEEEMKVFQAFHCVDMWHPYFYQQMCNLPNLENMFNWLNKHHFDFRGLISKGLALEAPEGMYND